MRGVERGGRTGGTRGAGRRRPATRRPRETFWNVHSIVDLIVILHNNMSQYGLYPWPRKFSVVQISSHFHNYVIELKKNRIQTLCVLNE